jgi:hypothetical protein
VTHPISRARSTCLAELVVLLLGVGGSLPAGAGDALPRWLHGEVQVSVGLDYSDGDYGEDEDTQMIYMPFTLAYVFDDFAPTPTRRDQLELRVMVPYLHVDGVFTAGVDETSTEDGIGDVRLSVLYVYYPTRTHLPAAELGFHTKLPTASESRGLGTGKVDYGLGLTLFQRVGDFVPFAAGHYRFVGENEPDYDLRDGAAASVGLGWTPLPSWSLGASYDWRQSISRRSTSSGALVRADDGHELTFYGSAPLGPDLQLSPYAVAGLSQGSPDYAVGFQLKLVIPVRPWEH